MIKNRDANYELNKAKDCIDKAIQILIDENKYELWHDAKANTSNAKKLDTLIMKIEKLQNC